eukprot:4394800-Amphidinium_carterae.1
MKLSQAFDRNKYPHEEGVLLAELWRVRSHFFAKAWHDAGKPSRFTDETLPKFDVPPHLQTLFSSDSKITIDRATLIVQMQPA